MSWVDEVAAAVAESGHLDERTREIVGRFVADHRGLLEALGPAAAREFFAVLTEAGPTGGAGPAWDALVGRLGQDELLRLLRQTGEEMDAESERRAAALRAWRELVELLGRAVLRGVLGAVL